MNTEKIREALEPIGKAYLIVALSSILLPIFLYAALAPAMSSSSAGFLLAFILIGAAVTVPSLFMLLMLTTFSISLYKIYKEILFDLSWADREESSDLMLKASIVPLICGLLIDYLYFPKLIPLENYFFRLIIFFYGGSFFYFICSSLLMVPFFRGELKKDMGYAFGAFGIASSSVGISYLMKNSGTINGFHLFIVIVAGLVVSYLSFYRLFRVLEDESKEDDIRFNPSPPPI